MLSDPYNYDFGPEGFNKVVRTSSSLTAPSKAPLHLCRRVLAGFARVVVSVRFCSTKCSKHIRPTIFELFFFAARAHMAVVAPRLLEEVPFIGAEVSCSMQSAGSNVVAKVLKRRVRLGAPSLQVQCSMWLCRVAVSWSLRVRLVLLWQRRARGS